MTIEEEVADEIAGIVTGEGYYAMTIGIDAAREAVEAIAPILNRVRAEGWFAGYDKGNLDSYFGTSKERENSPYAEFDPYREQNSEGNET